MENPFPGMDPWMEQQWGDAHAAIILYARDQLRLRLPLDLKARAEERVYVAAELPERKSNTRTPDLRIVERKQARTGESAAGTAVAAIATATPVIVSLGSDPVTESFIEIRERRPS